MQAILGVIFHFIGGFASGSFYMPYNKVEGWKWECYWIVRGVFSWLIVPPLAAWLTIPNFWQIIQHTGSSTLFYTYHFGLLWGVGGLTYGLGVRYLGVALGSSIILGLCMVFGSLVPSFYYQFFPQGGKDSISAIAGSTWGLTVLCGLSICVIGIIFCGKAGTLKEQQLKRSSSNNSIPKSNNPPDMRLRKKVLVAEAVAADNGSTIAVFEEVAITPEAPPTAHGTSANNSIKFKFGLGITLAIILAC